MSALNSKLIRDLWHLKGQALAIALVIACGVATYVMFLSTLNSLTHTRAHFYQNYHFAQIFASLKRAPDRLISRIEDIPGVSQVQTRVVAPVLIEIPEFSSPITGVITSIPSHSAASLNRLYIISGRAVEPRHDSQIVISEAFAKAHHLRPGDSITVIVNGRRKRLTVVGTAISPEFIHQMRPGGIFPDYQRYGVMWMGHASIARVMDLEGAFNNVVLRLSYGANIRDVIRRLDTLLKPYGGTGAYGREDQSSNRFFSEELKQLENNSALFPVIFMGVAAFLLNVVVTRLLSTQRDQIATLKAFGYTNLAIAWHYIKFVILVVLVGVAIGVWGGIWLTHVMARLYMEFFRLPYLEYGLSLKVMLTATLISVMAGLSGAVFAVAGAVRLKPAEAMRPELPVMYRETLIERIGGKRFLSMPMRMILRHLGQRPFKSILTVIGIAFAGALTMTGRFQKDTVDFMMYIHYGLTQRDDLTITFTEPSSRRALYDLLGLPGVEYGEPFRTVPVRLINGHYRYRTGIQGLRKNGELMRVLSTRLEPVMLPTHGLVLTDYLAQLLHIHAGERITVEVLEGNRPIRRVPVVGLVKQYIGASGYMDLGALNRLLKSGPLISGVYLRVDPKKLDAIYALLKRMPRIAGVSVRRNEITNFQRIMQETMLFWSSVATLFAAIIAFGVVYNSARITLTERSRELASLRVLGFYRGEISYILLGELAILTLAAIPIGLALGRWLCSYIAATVESDLYRVPLIVQPSSYAFSSAVVIFSAAFSGFLIYRRLEHLDLIAVLKTRE